MPPQGSGKSKKELEYEEATRRLLGPGASVGGMHHHDMHLMSYIDRHNYATMRMYSSLLLIHSLIACILMFFYLGSTWSFLPYV